MSQIDWRVFNKKSCNEKQKFFQEHLQREPIFSFNSIEVGDHLVTQNKLYCHHFLCIGKNQANRPEIIHYYGTARRAIGRIVPISSGKSFGLCGKISTMVLPDESFIKDEDDLLEKKVQRIVWPSWLRRFSVEQVIERAKKREGESDYDLLKNNCEHFIVWCMCDFNISIQVTKAHLNLRSALYALLAGATHLARQEGIQRLLVLFFKLIANFSDEVADVASLASTSSNLSNIAMFSAYGITCLIETGIMIYGVWQAKKKCNEGIQLKTNREFASCVAEIVSKSVCRAGLGIAGSVVGQLVIPIPLLGSLVGGCVGAIIGHFTGVFIGWLVRKGFVLFSNEIENGAPLVDKSLNTDDDYDYDDYDYVQDYDNDEWVVINLINENGELGIISTY